jgi:hypothetical protein
MLFALHTARINRVVWGRRFGADGEQNGFCVFLLGTLVKWVAIGRFVRPCLRFRECNILRRHEDKGATHEQQRMYKIFYPDGHGITMEDK